VIVIISSLLLCSLTVYDISLWLYIIILMSMTIGMPCTWSNHFLFYSLNFSFHSNKNWVNSLCTLLLFCFYYKFCTISNGSYGCVIFCLWTLSPLGSITVDPHAVSLLLVAFTGFKVGFIGFKVEFIGFKVGYGVRVRTAVN